MTLFICFCTVPLLKLKGGRTFFLVSLDQKCGVCCSSVSISPAGGGVSLRERLKKKETKKKNSYRYSVITMASLDSGLKPLQNAMKMAKGAIQLDGENKPKVVSYTGRQS